MDALAPFVGLFEKIASSSVIVHIAENETRNQEGCNINNPVVLRVLVKWNSTKKKELCGRHMAAKTS